MSVAAAWSLPASAHAPAPEDVIARAAALVKRHPGCFWFWKPGAAVQDLDDVRLVVRTLRHYGDREAWEAAQALSKCLSPVSSGKS